MKCINQWFKNTDTGIWSHLILSEDKLYLDGIFIGISEEAEGRIACNKILKKED